MARPEDQQALERRWQEIDRELEQLDDLPPEDEDVRGQREMALRDEMKRVEAQLDPDRLERRIREGRWAGD